MWTWLVASYVLVVCIPLTVIDIREHRLPNTWVLPGYIVAVVAIFGSWLTTGVFPLIPIASGAAYFLFLFILAWFGGMGMGDVKLAGVLGIATGMVGVPAFVLSVVLTFFLAGLVSAGLLGVRVVTHRGQKLSWREMKIPFGPFMLAGSVCALVSSVATNVLS